MGGEPATGDGPPSAELLVATVGRQLKVLRKGEGLTLDDLSQRSGVSTGLISQVERGMGNPSFATLVQLAHGLSVPIGRLFLNLDQRSPVVRRHERRTLNPHGSNEDGVFELLTPGLDGALEAVWVETPPGHDTSATPYTHNGEEFGIVLSGRKDVYVDGVRHELGQFDSIAYSSIVPHWYVNPTSEPCTAIWVITPPTF